MFNFKPVKIEKLQHSFFVAVVTLLMALFFGLTSYVSQSFAVSSSTASFSSKIVYKTDGTNITTITPPACIVSGDSNDTCDFRIRYYSGETGGVLRGTEVFADVEIGQYDGLLNLSFGSGSFTAGTCTSGECDSVNKIFLYNNDIHILVDFNSTDTSAGAGSFTSAETFSTTGLATPTSTDSGFAVRATPYSIWSLYSGTATTALLANNATTSVNLVGSGSLTNAVDLATAEVSGVLGISHGGTNNSVAYTAGSVIFADGTKLNEDNANFFYNNSTDRLGIGTSNPLSKLEVAGGIYTDAMSMIIPTVDCVPTGGTLAAGTYSYRLSYEDGNGVESDASYEVSDSFTGTQTGSCTVSWTDVSGMPVYEIYRRYYDNSTASFTSWDMVEDSGSPFVDDGSVTWVEKDPELQGDGLVASGNLVVRSTIPIGMKAFGGLDADYAYHVAQDSEGNYVLVGTTSSYGVGGQDIIAAEYDKQGNLLWIKTYGGIGDDIGYSVVSDAAGSYIIVGSTTSYGVGGQDAFILKIGENGTVMWARTFGGTNTDYATSVTQVNDGTYFVTGYTLSYGSGGYVMNFKMDDAGEVTWTRHVGGTSGEIGQDAVFASDETYVVVGNTASYGAGGTDIYLMKLSNTGTLTWTKTIGGSGADTANAIIQAPDGGFIIVGTTASFGVSGTDIYVIQTNSSGDVIWTKTFGGTGNEVGTGVTFTMDGGYLVSGSTTSYGAGSTDMYLIKIESDGTLQWTRTIGDTGADQAESVAQSDDTGYMIAGWTTLTTGSQGIDIFTAKLDKDGQCTGCTMLNVNPGTPTITTNNAFQNTGGSNTTGGISSASTAARATLVTGSTLGVGLYKYKVTFYTGSGETLPGNAVVFVTTTSGNTNINLASVPTGATGTTGRRIYRTTVNGDTYYRVAQIANNTTTTYNDSTSDTTLISTGASLNGIQAGGSAPNLTLAASTALGIGTYKYLVTAYGTGSYSANEVLLSPVTQITTTAGNRQVNLTAIPVGASNQVTGRKIYRTDVDGTVFKLLTTIANNTTTTFNDTTADGSLGVEISIPLIGTQTGFCMNNSAGSVLIAGGNGILSVTGQIRAAGNVFANTFYGKEVKLTNYDLAEDYKVTDKEITAGDVVMVDTSVGEDSNNSIMITKSTGKYESKVMGVVSTKPGITLTDWSIPSDEREYMRAIALVGRVPVKVSTENGPIKKGDYLVSASKPGYAMNACGEKYCESGMVIGMALESFSGYVKGDTDLVKETLSASKTEIENQIENVTNTTSDGTVTDTELKLQNDLGEEMPVSELTDLVDSVQSQVDQLTEDMTGDTLGEGRIMIYVTRTYYIPPKLDASIKGVSDSTLVDSSNFADISGLTEGNGMSMTNVKADTGFFSTLTGGTLNIGNGNLVSDNSGNLTVLGDLVIGGLIRSRGTDVGIQLGDGGVFAIKDKNGTDIFTVSDKGIFGGNAVKRSGWLKVPAGSSIEFAHNLSVNDIDVSLVKAVDLNTGIYTYKGAGTDYYWQVVDYNRIKVFNTTSEDISVRVKVTGWEDVK